MAQEDLEVFRLQDILAKMSRVSLSQTVRVLRALIVLLNVVGEAKAASILTHMMKVGEAGEFELPDDDNQEATDEMYGSVRKVVGNGMLNKLRKNEIVREIFW